MRQIAWYVSRMDLEGRGTIPEIEIRYEGFAAKAIEAAEKFIDLDRLRKLAAPSMQNPVDYNAFSEKFKNLLADLNHKLKGGFGEICL